MPRARPAARLSFLILSEPWGTTCRTIVGRGVRRRGESRRRRSIRPGSAPRQRNTVFFVHLPNPLGGAYGAASRGYSGTHVRLLFNLNRPMSRRHYVMARGRLHRDTRRAETIDRTVTEYRAFRLSAKPAPPGAALSTFSYAARPMRRADRMSCSGCSNTRSTQRKNAAREHSAWHGAVLPTMRAITRIRDPDRDLGQVRTMTDTPATTPGGAVGPAGGGAGPAGDAGGPARPSARRGHHQARFLPGRI